jgi:hypothetical protein
MDGSWMRSGVISCAIACGVMVAGPGIVGSAVATAGLLGIGGDDGILIFGDDDDHKRSARHPSPADAGAARATADEGAPTSTIGATRVADGGEPTSTFGGEITSGGGGGGGAVPQYPGADRAANLAPVSTAPTTREIVIRGTPPAVDDALPAAPVPEIVSPMPPTVVPPALTPPEIVSPAIVPPAIAPPAIVPPAIVPPAIVPPAPVVVPPAPPAGRHEPPSSPIPVTQQPRANNPLAPPDSFGPSPMPDWYRVGYPEYLRAATVTDLMVVALPGVAGMTLLTAAGGALGYRQARWAGQAALMLTPAAARFVK